jgi:hypothetical protein
LKWLLKKGVDKTSKINPANRTAMRCNRIALLYDFMEAPMEQLRFSTWRKCTASQIMESLRSEYHIAS